MLKGPFSGFNSQQELDEFLRDLPKYERAFQVARSFNGLSKKQAADRLFKLVIEHGGDDAAPDGHELLNAAIREHLNAKTIDHFMDAVGSRWTKYKQSEIAKKLRPKKISTRKNITIKAMQMWARGNGDRTLRGFLEAAENGSVTGLDVSQAKFKDIKRYTITPEQPIKKEASETVAFKTLEEWWTASRKDFTPD